MMRFAAVLVWYLAASFSLVGWTPRAAYAEAYRWVDAAGIVHLTEDSSRVPSNLRGRARVEVPIDTEAISLTGSAPAVSRASNIIPFETEGQLMRVMVRLNDRVTAPFYLDTGSTDIVLPEAVAKLLASSSEVYEQVILETPTGRVHAQALQLASVRMGAAQVQNVRATVAPALEIGLLGGAFLNQFRYSIDPDTQTLTLERRKTPASDAN